MRVHSYYPIWNIGVFQTRVQSMCLVFKLKDLHLQLIFKLFLHICCSTIASQWHPEIPGSDLLFQILQLFNDVILDCSWKRVLLKVLKMYFFGFFEIDYLSLKEIMRKIYLAKANHAKTGLFWIQGLCPYFSLSLAWYAFSLLSRTPSCW